MPLIDLTAELAHGMVRHPAPHLPEVEIVQAATHETHARSVQRVTFGTHVSTHIDAPLHGIAGGTSIDEIPLETFCGEALLIRLPDASLEKPIDASDLEPYKQALDKHDRVIFDTGWARETWGSRGYFTKGTYLTEAAATFLANAKLLMIGMDFPNIDSVENTRAGFKAPNHQILLGVGTVLLENLLNLHLIPGDTFRVIALPLKLIGGDGCPCRAIAEI